MSNQEAPSSLSLQAELEVKETGSTCLYPHLSSWCIYSRADGKEEEEDLPPESLGSLLSLAPFMTHCQIWGFHNDNTLPLTKRTNTNQGVFLPRRRKNKEHYTATAAIDLLAPFPWKQRAEQEREKLLRIIGGFVLWVAFLKIKPTRCLHSLRSWPCTALLRSQ